MTRKFRIQFFILLFAILLLIGSALAADKIGNQHLAFDEKENIHYLSLCNGQSWSSGPEKPFKSIATRADEPSIAEGAFLPTSEPNSINMKISGKASGNVKVFFDLEVVGMAAKTTTVFQVTVTPDCPDSNKGKIETPEPPAAPSQEWDWSYPTFKKNAYFTGDAPQCYLSNGDLSPAGDIELLGMTKLGDESYFLQSGENSVWTQWFDWKLGKLGVRKVTSSKKEVAVGTYSTNNGKFTIKTFKPGEAEIKVEFAILPPNSKPKKQDIKWKQISFIVNVLATKTDEHQLCTGEVKAPELEPIPDACPSNAVKTTKPGFKIPAPSSLTQEEQALATSIGLMLKNSKSLPPVCSNEVIQRQAKKVAHAFYALSPPKGNVSCVDCSRDVANTVIDALEDEDVACIKVTRAGRQEPVFKLALHTVSAIGPACTKLNDDWMVLDTWFWLGQIGGKHKHRVFNYGEWRYENNAEWGAERLQPNLPDTPK